MCTCTILQPDERERESEQQQQRTTVFIIDPSIGGGGGRKRRRERRTTNDEHDGIGHRGWKWKKEREAKISPAAAAESEGENEKAAFVVLRIIVPRRDDDRLKQRPSLTTHYYYKATNAHIKIVICKYEWEREAAFIFRIDCFERFHFSKWSNYEMNPAENERALTETSLGKNRYGAYTYRVLKGWMDGCTWARVYERGCSIARR